MIRENENLKRGNKKYLIINSKNDIIYFNNWEDYILYMENL